MPLIPYCVTKKAMAMNNEHRIEGVVLAGGESKRFGEDKGLYRYKGKPLVMHAVEILREICTIVRVSTNRQQPYRSLGLHTICDVRQGGGPLVGIYTALSQAKEDLLAVIPCDTPHVAPDLYTALLNHAGENDAVLPSHKGCLEPACAIYHKRCLSEMEQAIQRKQYKILEALKNVNVNIVRVDSQPFYHPGMFHNINYKSDL